MAALGLLDIEAYRLDPFGDVEVEHLPRHRQAFRRQYRDHMERDTTMAQQPQAGNCVVEGPAPRSRASMAIVQMPWAVDADADIDTFLDEERTPRVVDQRPVGLEGVLHRQPVRLDPIDHPERVPIEANGHEHRFARVPYHRQAIADPTRREDLREQIDQRLERNNRLRPSIGKITIAAIDIAERRRLNDQQPYSGHDGSRRLPCIDHQITSCATSCSSAAGSSANCSSWAAPIPTRDPAGPN